MAEPCQPCLSIQAPEPPLIELQLHGDAAGDAPGCGGPPAQASQAEKPAGLDIAEVVANMQPAESGTGAARIDNLDGGWAWLVMFAALFTHILTFGMSYATLGAFHVELLEEFGGTNAETSWTGSIMLGVMLCTGPLISVFIDKFGACAVAVVGGAMASAGFILSAMATSLLHLYFSFGVLAGLGFGMSYLPCIVMLGNFFERRRAFAAGISASGSGLGTFLFAPINQSLLANLGWRHSFIVLGALELMLCLCGFTYLARKIPVRGLVGESAKDVGGDEGGDEGGADSMTHARTETSTPSMVIVSRPGTGTSMQSLSSTRTNGADHDIISVGSWRQSIGVKMGRSVLLQSPANSPVPASSVLLDSFFGLSSSPVVNNATGSCANDQAVGESSSRVSAPGPVPKIEITYASSPPSPVASPTTQSPDVGDFAAGSWQQSVIVRAGLSNFLQSPITSPPSESPLAMDNMSRLSVPSNQELSLHRLTSEYNSHLATAIAPDCVPEDVRLYPLLDELSDHGAAISATCIEATLQEAVDEDNSSVSGNEEGKASVKLPRNCKACSATLVMIRSLFHNRFFVLFWLSGFILCIGYQLPYMYFKAFALSRGLEQDTWAVILSVMGITDTLGRLVVGFVFDRAMCISHRLMGYVASLFISGLLLALMSTASSYPTLTITAATYTLVAGSTDPLVPALLVEYVGLESLCYSFGLVIEMQGLGFLVGPPLAGYVYAYIQDYSAIYVVGAIAFLGSGVVLLQEPVLAHIQKWREKRQKNNAESVAAVEIAELAA